MFHLSLSTQSDGDKNIQTFPLFSADCVCSGVLNLESEARLLVVARLVLREGAVHYLMCRNEPVAGFDASSPASDVSINAVSAFGVSSVLTTAAGFTYSPGWFNCTFTSLPWPQYINGRNTSFTVAPSANGDVLNVKVRRVYRLNLRMPHIAYFTYSARASLQHEIHPACSSAVHSCEGDAFPGCADPGWRGN